MICVAWHYIKYIHSNKNVYTWLEFGYVKYQKWSATKELTTVTGCRLVLSNDFVCIDVSILYIKKKCVKYHFGIFNDVYTAFLYFFVEFLRWLITNCTEGKLVIGGSTVSERLCIWLFFFFVFIYLLLFISIFLDVFFRVVSICASALLVIRDTVPLGWLRRTPFLSPFELAPSTPSTLRIQFL